MKKISETIVKLANFCGKIGKSPNEICIGCSDYVEGESVITIISKNLGEKTTRKVLMIAHNSTDTSFKIYKNDKKISASCSCIMLDKILSAMIVLQHCK